MKSQSSAMHHTITIRNKRCVEDPAPVKLYFFREIQRKQGNGKKSNLMLTYPWAIQKTRQCFFLTTIWIQNSSIRKSSFASFEGDKEEVKSVLFLNRNFQMKIICWQLQSIKKQSWQKRLIYVVEVKNNIYIKYIWFFVFGPQNC